MTEVTSEAPKIIVVAEPEVYDLLTNSGVYWDTQHQIESITQMWDDLAGGRVDSQNSVAIVFSDSIFATEGELEAAMGVLAPFAATFLITRKGPQNADAVISLAREFAVSEGQDPNAPIYLLDPNSKRGALDTIKSVLSGVVAFPDQYQGDVDGPMSVTTPEADAWDPADPAPAMAAPIAAPAAPAYNPAPAAPAAPAYNPAPAAPAYSPAPPAYNPPGAIYQEQPTADQPLDGQVTIAVTSSKGGSGKSTTAMMLAAQIAHSSQKAYEQGLIARPLKVCLVDMDTRDGQVSSLIGKYVPTALNIRVQPTWDKDTILQNLVSDSKLGIDALLPPVRPRTADDVGPDFYRHVIRILKTTHDVVIMDTSVNYLDPLISTVCLPEATAILFVTTLAATSVHGMARALREITMDVEDSGMGIKRSKIGIVVNQSVPEVGMDKDQVLTAALKVSIVGAIPLATKDVLTCTNFNRMHQLLKHPLLGPAYYSLAKTCLPNVPLVPILGEGGAGGTGGRAPAPTGPAPQPAAPASAAPAPAPQPERKRGLFSRKG